MVIVAGHLMVAPDERERYLASCVAVVELARGTPGCLDFAISADLIDPGRINILERWESRSAVEAFRGAGFDAHNMSGGLLEWNAGGLPLEPEGGHVA